MSTECTWTRSHFSALSIFTEYSVWFIQNDYNPNVQLVDSIAALIVQMKTHPVKLNLIFYFLL